MKKDYDLIVIGGGPGGLSAAIYAARYKLNTLVISKNIGGLAATAYKICNWPSQDEIKGFELMQKFTKQVTDLNVPIIYDEVSKIEKTNEGFIVSITNKKYNAKKIIFAAGTKRLRLNVLGEGKFVGRGVSYCATCDASFFKNKIVSVVGGSNGAITSALLLSEYASKVYLIHKDNQFPKAEPAWIELLKTEDKIELVLNEEIIEINGNKNVEEIKLKSGKKIKVDGVFVEIGGVPETGLLENLKVKLNEKGYIITDKEQKTNLKGLFAAGDITNNVLKQIVTASSEGAVAAYSAYKEVKKHE
ncbi:MAG: FAD-dependent oxidoreductase [Candidatus Pacearchaeota archaeon]|jgi:thioredoxin reductase (NADPH)